MGQRPRDEPRETCELARRELALAALLCALGSALLFWSPLFGGRCTLSFELSDPRLDVLLGDEPALVDLREVDTVEVPPVPEPQPTAGKVSV